LGFLFFPCFFLFILLGAVLTVVDMATVIDGVVLGLLLLVLVFAVLP